MRLTCPNCGAQYEVPDEVIPEAGRDVQCSNCGDTWFQHHPDHAPAEEGDDKDTSHPGWDSPEEEPENDFAPEDEAGAPDAQEATDEPVAEAPSEPEPEPQPEPEETEAPDAETDEVAEEEPDSDEPDDQMSDDDDSSDFAPEPDEDTLPPRRELDSSIADVLREEAAREQEAREAESGGGLETQPDLGLDDQSSDADQRSQEAKSRMARMRGLPEDSIEDDGPEPDPELISRRNLLPDIDEINSSLDSDSVRSEAEHAASDMAYEEGAAAQKGGFRKGFMRIVLLVLLLVILYLLAPVISEKVPALSGAMSAYVDVVNSGRIWLNDMISGAMAPK